MPGKRKPDLSLFVDILQTLENIGTEKNTTVIFPLPIELVSLLGKFIATGNPATASEDPQKSE